MPGQACIGGSDTWGMQIQSPGGILVAWHVMFTWWPTYGTISLPAWSKQKKFADLFLRLFHRFCSCFCTSVTIRYVPHDSEHSLDMAHTAVLLGHSFVVGLQDHFSHSSGRGSSHGLQRYVTHQLRCDDFFSEIYFLGQRGATIPQLAQYHQHLCAIKPKVLIFDIATNDLSQSSLRYSEILRLTYQYKDLVVQLLEACGAHIAYICSCLPRMNNIRSGTPAQFLHTANVFNNCMKAYCSINGKLVFHAHKGFSGTSTRQPLTISTWSRDGIHPNTRTGRSLYKRSIRAALLDSIQHIER